MKTKLVRDLEIGDVVVSEDGESLKISAIGKGFFTAPSRLLTYSNGVWSCLRSGMVVEVKV